MTAQQNPAKVALRKKVQGLLNEMTKESRDKQSNAITEKVLAMSEYKNAKRVSIYLSTDDEVNTLDILKDIFNSGKKVNHRKLFEFLKSND